MCNVRLYIAFSLDISTVLLPPCLLVVFIEHKRQCVVYSFKCSLCDKDYVDFTNRHLVYINASWNTQVPGLRLENTRDNNMALIIRP